MTQPPPPTHPTASTALPWWVTTIVLLGVALTAAGAILALVHPASLLSPGEQMNQAARVYAHYLVARNLAVAILLGVLLALRARRMLAGLLVLTALIQLLDAGLDAATGRWALVPGLLVLTAAFLVGAARLCGQALWQVGTWQDTPTPPAERQLHHG
jgi:hypothetical protein